jgi:hypothetical protein
MATQKRYSEMTTAELRETTAEYDREWTSSALPGQPLTPADRALHKRARNRRTVSNGGKTVPVKIERDLLRKVDALVKRHKLKGSDTGPGKAA